MAEVVGILLVITLPVCRQESVEAPYVNNLYLVQASVACCMMVLRMMLPASKQIPESQLPSSQLDPL